MQALQAIGCHVIRLDTPCDLLVVTRGRLVALEVKLPGPPSAQRLTEIEAAFARQCEVHEAPWYVVTSPAEAIAAVRH